MASIIEMPKLSDTMEEGAIAEWLKKEGDSVEEGESFVAIETDKATMEYQSPEGGILVKILVPAGKACALNSPIAVIAKKNEKVDVQKLLDEYGAKNSKSSSNPSAQDSTKHTQVSAKAPMDAAPSVSLSVKGERLKASPLAKKMANDLGIDLHQVKGSGPNGRIISRDLEGATKVSSSAQKSGGTSTSYTLGVSASREDRIVPVSMMRKTIAKRLLSAKNDAPHFYLNVSVNMKEILDWRKKLNDTAKDSGETKISVTDLIVFCTAQALRRHPEVNASWEGDQMRLFGGVHLAIAVALEQGLVTPVIRNCDQLGIRQIAQVSSQLFAKAKAGQLSNEDYAGGSFSISNLGMFGIEDFTAIINPPQAAILAIGATIPTPWVNAKGEVEAQSRMKMTMSCDHRVIDGAVGAKFLKTLVSFLEDPKKILE